MNINLSDLTTTDINLSNIACIKQTWKNKDIFSYINTPRKNSGLMLTLNCNIHYYFTDGHDIFVPPNSVMLLTENSNYYVEIKSHDEPYPLSSITLNFNMTDYKFKPVTFNKPAILIYQNTPADIKDLFFTLSDCYVSSAKNMLTLKSRLFNLLNRLSLTYDHENSQLDAQNPIFKAVRYIENHLTEQMSISELSKLCLVSEATLRRNFKTFIGMSPIDYMNKLKIQKAKQLLKNPEIPITSLYEQLNFYDTSYFYKLFKRHTNMTPMQYRNSQL